MESAQPRGRTPEPPVASAEDLRRLIVAARDPLCAEPPLGDLNAWITPVERFFVRSHFPIPEIDVTSWRLVIDGEVEHPLSLNFADLRRLAESSIVATLECAGNSRTAVQPPAEGVQWGHGAVGTARWNGVPLAALLEKAGPKAGAREVVFQGADHGREAGVEGEIQYAMSIPLEKARQPDTLVALEMNGAPLTPHHGFPARVVVPGWYGMASVKWVTRIHLSREPFEGYYRTRAYVFIREGDDPDARKPPVTALQVKSLITWPPEDSTVPPGRHVIRGFAWSGAAPIVRVEIATWPIGGSGDGAPWETATLLEPREPNAWVRWEVPVELDRPGYYVLRARATDADGNTQPVRADWNFRGVATNSMHALPVIVRHGGPASPATPVDER